MSRLPVYLLLDCSGSMAGEPVAALRVGLRALIGEMRDDPYAAETVWVGAVTFASTAHQVAPLAPLDRFVEPECESGGTGALGEALALLRDVIADECRPRDFRPVVFVFTDGSPTDEWRAGVRKFRDDGAGRLVAVGTGSEVCGDALRDIGDDVLQLADAPPGALAAMLRWDARGDNP